MKTHLILFALAITLSACKPKSAQQQKTIPKPAGTQAAAMVAPGRSLNNIDENTALKMIDDFANRRALDKKPDPGNVWFSRDMIHNIVTLLHQEIAEQIKTDPNGTDVIDGVRICYPCFNKTKR
jgi:hypothetical protein